MRSPQGQPRLLVSVRSIEEALAALEGGAELIDIKEPSRGALGAAEVQLVEQIIQLVRGRVPVSAALGEWVDYVPFLFPEGLRFAKWGLAGLSQEVGRALSRIRETLGVKPVLVAYADFLRSRSPSISELAEAACALRFPAFLIDTGIKDGSTLLDWIPIGDLLSIREQCGRAGIQLALAGSLNERSIQLLASVQPDWFAVRGAACVGGREGAICAARVRSLRNLIENLRTSHFED
jgi:(5-formylfuran-3-yl)methyl phosphate synthase